MKIARMDKRIELLHPMVAEDEFGGMKTEYTSEGFIWAELKRTNYAEQEAQGTPMSREQLRFYTRPLMKIKRGWIVVYDSERYIVDTVDRTYRDSITIIVHRYEQGI